MTSTKNRSSSAKKTKRRVPSGKSRDYYSRRKNTGKKGSCAVCRMALQGIQNSGAKSSRRPERIFGGVLCPKCQSRVVVEASRVREKSKSIEDVDIIYRSYVEGIVK